MLSESIAKLVQYGITTGLTPECERNYTTNLLLDVFHEDDYEKPDNIEEPVNLEATLGELLDEAVNAVKGACQQLETFGIPYEAHILSAHRTPAAAADFARSARANGFGVLICAAGMAAHLAGAFAGNSTLPVIGIPMKGGAADGLDALLATVQMPSGIPVATVAINGAKNAAVLAAQILAVSDDALAAKLDAQRSEMAEQIAAKEAKLQAELAH